MSGAQLDGKVVGEAREEEMKWFAKKDVYVKTKRNEAEKRGGK